MNEVTEGWGGGGGGGGGDLAVILGPLVFSDHLIAY